MGHFASAADGSFCDAYGFKSVSVGKDLRKRNGFVHRAAMNLLVFRSRAVRDCAGTCCSSATAVFVAVVLLGKQQIVLHQRIPPDLIAVHGEVSPEDTPNTFIVYVVSLYAIGERAGFVGGHLCGSSIRGAVECPRF